jgi:hypothetical protein
MLTYLATLRLEGISPPPFGALPDSIQSDVKGIWGSYQRLLKDADEYLFSLGRDGVIRDACLNARVGKLLPEDLYVHKSLEDNLPALVLLLVFAAQQIVGEVSYDVLKVRLDARALSFLSYEDQKCERHTACGYILHRASSLLARLSLLLGPS